MSPLRMRTWADVSLERIEENYRQLRGLAGPDCQFLGVVKANAYGHGAIPVARLLRELGAERLAVACVEEAVELRQAGVDGPILIFGDTPEPLMTTLLEYDLTQTVFSLDMAQALSQHAKEHGKTLPIHIEADTGMSRLGFLCPRGEEAHAAAEIGQLKRLPNLHLEGIFTHFANADGDEAYTMEQFTRFLELTDALEGDHGLKFEIRHCAASSAVIHYPCTHLDMIRPGLALYGMYPTQDGKDIVPLRPAMELRSRIIDVRRLPAGTPVGYGCTHVLEKDAKVAVLPIGYADGLHRICSNRMPVLIRGEKAMQIGRVCMDLTMVDVTGIPDVQVGDVATLFGEDAGAFLPVEDLAQLAGTISYELVCAPSARVPRVYGLEHSARAKRMTVCL